jgi:heme/copper-type cytochrome/quinol oxidase subunit 1
MLAAIVLFGINVVVTARRRVPVPADPWRANSLEWATSSPPPEYNFLKLPPIRSERPVFDARHPELAAETAR